MDLHQDKLPLFSFYADLELMAFVTFLLAFAFFRIYGLCSVMALHSRLLLCFHHLHPLNGIFRNWSRTSFVLGSHVMKLMVLFTCSLKCSIHVFVRLSHCQLMSRILKKNSGGVCLSVCLSVQLTSILLNLCRFTSWFFAKQNMYNLFLSLTTS